MNSMLARVLGFAAPTVGLVLALHLKRESGWGAGLDGLVSGLAFTLPFAATVALRARIAPVRRGAAARGALHEVGLGFLASAIAWCALWLAWTLPSMQPFRGQAFAVNAVAMALAGMALPPVRPGERGPGAPELDEATTAIP